ncbi:dTDP-4-dehydrorhamnose 3,5-epimerase [Lewinella sp. JB7]|uniref:dTDP-4-dehydrorhamnose 3,5-epimerase n=1 Tax=Lewinella sp. JB7 TaxID=2962887 RepID=UPI0020C95C5D|nr:dTDP-4-dehydrorhamnose 3,5-epimerase [Lewinella sp. JB7]MCP9236804.1 dTDP-4-dehydrorhamnose 3,5-epimerase [Lewinella sp. JB7]
MPFTTTPLPGLQVFEPRIFGDDRGHFLESYNQRTFAGAGIDTVFVQDNEAVSARGVLRGLHFQRESAAQTKLVRVTSGEVFDVTVDIRPDSPTYRQWYGIYLSGDNYRQLYIPRGFAHGYLVTSERATFLYKCDNFYAPEAEGGLRYDDPALGIEWPIIEGGYRVAERDRQWPLLT